MNYSQPHEYRFNKDSIELVSFAYSYVNQDVNLKVLDVGAGCGVIGLEFINKLNRDFHRVDFVEKQSAFFQHLDINLKKENARVFKTDWLKSNNIERDYDIIFSNPPYFFKDEGKPSLSDIRNDCRRISRDDLIVWFNKVHMHLKCFGFFFLTFRDVDFVYEYVKNNSEKWAIEGMVSGTGATSFCFRKVSVEYKDL